MFSISFEEFKEVLGEDDVKAHSPEELTLLYRVHVAFGDYTYKKWAQALYIQTGTESGKM
jgi:hypothetical protein